MDIFVLVKQVPDPEAMIRVKSKSELEIENRYFTNFFDEIAIEAAIRMKEKFGGKVTVITVDDKRVDALRRGISMGADEAIQISDPFLEGANPFIIAKAIASYLREKNFDLIFAGRQSMDDDSGIVGPAVAELLGIPHVNAIVSIEMDQQKGVALVKREVEQGREIIECSLPALFTCEKGLYSPRIPQVMNVMRAMKVQIKKFDLLSLGLNLMDLQGEKDMIKIKGYFPPPKRPPVKIIKEEFPENVKILVKLLREEAKVI